MTKQKLLKKETVFKSIDEILGEILGLNTKEALYFHIILRKKIEKDKLATNLTALIEELKSIFGPASDILINEIIRKISSTFNTNIKTEEDFKKFLNSL